MPSPPPSVLDRVAALEGVAQDLRHLIDLASNSGDVVISKNNLDTFQAAHKDDDGSVWKLCNGVGGTLNMTGRYPRGAGANTPPPGDPQEQSIQNHSHELPGWAEMPDARGGGDNHVLRTGFQGAAPHTSGVLETPVVAGGETRPATTVVNFFCRVR